VPTVPADFTLRVGVDAIGVGRLERLLADHPASAEELFTEQELRYCRSKRRCTEHLAARFAAKEAVLKAFGTGVSQRMRFADVEVVNDSNGRPQVRLGGEVASFAQRRGLSTLDVSMTHTEGMAIAHVASIWRGGQREQGGGARCASI
jgi:holo-[acyl-carrier protein] synthase